MHNAIIVRDWFNGEDLVASFQSRSQSNWKILGLDCQQTTIEAEHEKELWDLVFNAGVKWERFDAIWNV